MCITFQNVVVELCVALLHVCLVHELLSTPSAVPFTIHMEEIKVRHGAKARNGALVLTCCVSVVTFRGSQDFGNKRG